MMKLKSFLSQHLLFFFFSFPSFFECFCNAQLQHIKAGDREKIVERDKNTKQQKSGEKNGEGRKKGGEERNGK